MAGSSFSAELLISTTKANKEIRDLTGQVGVLDKSLAGLGKTLRDTQGNLDATVAGISKIVQASREASKASDESARAKLAEAKAQAELAKTENASQIAQARVERERSAAAVNQSAVAYREARTQAVNYATAQRAVKASTDDVGNSLANQRYLLYDVGDTYRTLGIALSALPTAAVVAASSYEKSFAQVLRVTGGVSEATGTLREDLKNLATEIPLSFSELSSIAQIGGQMDIPTEQLGAFTETVAKFVATADGATIDSSTQAFGRLANLFANDMTGDEQAQFFERIGSAISYVADTSVTSEAKIVAMLDKIAPIGAQAGLSAEQVVAFGAAMSSVGLAPEISSGFLTRFFGNLNKDVAAGGDALNAYNKILGTTSAEFLDMYHNDPSSVVQRLVEAMSKMDKVSQTSALGELGISATRDQRVVQALAGSYDVLAQSLENSSQAYAESSYLDQSSQGIFNTLVANLQKLMNSFTNLGDTIGAGMIPTLSTFVGIVANVTNGINDLANTSPAFKTFLAVLASASSVLGIFFALRSATAFFKAGLVTLTHVAKQSAGGNLTLTNQLRNLATVQLQNKGASEATAQSLIKQMGAVKAVGASATLTTTQLRAMNVQLLAGNTAVSSFGAGMRGAGRIIGGLATAIGPGGLLLTGLSLVASGWYEAGQQAKASAESIVSAAQVSGDATAEALAKAFAGDKVSLFSAGTNKFFDDNIGKSFLDVADKIGVGVDQIAEAVGNGREGVEAYIAVLRRMQSEAPRELGNEYGIIIGKLETLRDEMELQEKTSNAASDAQQGLANSGGELAESLGLTEDALGGVNGEVKSYADSLNEAIEAAFGLTNAQSGVNSALESLGKGVSETGAIGTGSEGARSNLADYQKTLAMQGALLAQQVEAGKITAQEGATQFQSFAAGLLEQLNSMGVDTSGIIADTESAISAIQTQFGEGGVAPLELQVQANTTQATMDVDYLMSYLDEYLSDPKQLLLMAGGVDETAQDVTGLVNYISELTGLPFQAVIDAITNPASENAQHVAKYMSEVVGTDYTAFINADTSAAASNVQNFAVYANNQLAQIAGQASAISALVGGPAGQVIGAAYQNLKVLATPAQTIAKANKAAIPSFAPLKRGYDDAAKAAQNAGRKAGGAGKAAKKAGDEGAKAAKKAGKAVKDQAKDWDELEQQITGYASRVGTAFGYVTAKQTGVDEAKDEYYSILNGIQDRLEQQKQTVKDLRNENKALNAERRVQLNDAGKLEKMAGYADRMGNSERAKVYRDEAKALKENANETAEKIKANEAEAKAISKGIGQLDGYSQAAIENRKEVRSLRDASLAVAEAYAKSGASAKTVADQTKAWTDKAKSHSKELGYTKTAVDKVTGSTNSYVTAVRKVPKTVNTSIKATNSTASGVSAAKKSIGTVPSSKTTSLKAKSSGVGSVKSQLDAAAKTRTATVKARFTMTAAERKKYRTLGATMQALGNFPVGSALITLSNLYNKGGKVKRFASGGLIPGTPPSNPREDNIMATIDGKGMAAIRSGEYIQSQPAVDYYGSDVMDKLNRMEIPRYALGGVVGGNSNSSGNMGSSVIDLSAETIQSIARLVQKDIYLYADTQMLAQSVQKGLDTIAQRGGSVT